MAYLQIGDQQFVLRAGAQRIAADGSADIPIPGADAAAAAVVEVNPGQHVIIRRASSDSVVSVNGVSLGPEPAPLMHGDRVQIGGREIRFGDSDQSGSTQFITSNEVADVIRARAGLPARPTKATGGRLVSLVDGREYAVASTGLVIGRDPSADVVIPAAEVSRRHVSIAPAEAGYLLKDHSTNGVWVNGSRVETEQLLGRGDIIKVATEEFRFYADVAKTPQKASDAPQVVASAPPTGASDATAGSPATASEPMDPSAMETALVLPDQPAGPVASQPQAAAAPPTLAVLTVLNEGPDKGRQFQVTSPRTDIGRGAHNDLVLPNESISDAHAKLQLREAGWVLVDLDSTNGTYVGGRRVMGEQLLTGAPDLRFGDVKVGFRSVVETAANEKSTRAITGVSLEQARRSAEARQARSSPTPVKAPASRAGSSDASPSRSGPLVMMLVLVVAAALVWWFFLRGA